MNNLAKKRIFMGFVLTLFAAFCMMMFAACSRVEFRVDFVVDDTVYATVNTNGEEVVKMPNDPEKEGFVFDGWFWDNGSWQKPFTANSLLDAPLSSNMVVYAKWVTDYDLLGTEALFLGFAKISDSEYAYKAKNSVATLALNEIVRTSARTTWTLSSDVYGNNVIASKTATLVVGDNTWYVLAKAEDNTTKLYTLRIRRRPMYSMIFDVGQGERVEAQQIEEDSLATEPTTTRTGYEFMGWNYDFSTPIVENKIVVATWQAKTYTLTLNANGGDVDAGQMMVRYDAEYTLPEASRRGYTFEGWFCNDEAFGNGTWATADGLAITAKWLIANYTLGYELNGGEVSAENPTSYTVENGIITLNNPTKTGYTFLGWTGTGLTGLTKTVTILGNSVGNRNYEAHWAHNDYKIEYEPNGGENNQSNPSGYSIETPNIYLENATRTGYLFDGWYEESSFTNKMMVIYAGSHGDIKLYAKWTPIFYTIRFDGNRQTSGAMLNQTFTYDKAQSLTTNAFYRTGYRYDGWTTHANGTGDAYANEESVVNLAKINGDEIVLYAKWTANTNTITLNKMGGSGGTDEVTATYDADMPAATAPTRDYFSFGGYYSETDGGGVQYYSASMDSLRTWDIDSDSMLYAKWKDERAYTEGLSFALAEDGLSYGVSKYTGTATNVTIPMWHNGLPVKEIGKESFLFCNALTRVVIPNSITSIGGFAFSNCGSLDKVIIPNGVVSIGEYAFSDCRSLTSITIPTSVTSMGDYALDNCTSLEYEIYAGTLKYVNDWLIGTTDTAITTANLKPTTVGIYHAAFKNHSGLTEIIIPDSVVHIGGAAFFGCSSLASIAFAQGSKLANIGNETFRGCSRLTSIAIPAGVTSIGNAAFYSNNNLTYVTFAPGSKLTSIGSDAFRGCSNLTSIAIPSGVTSIGDSALYNCSMAIIYFERTSSTGITLGSDWNYNNNRPIYYGVTEATFVVIGGIHYVLKQDGTATVTNRDMGITSATILASVTIGGTIYKITNIGDYAFYGCNNLTSITFAQDSKLESIGSSAFYNCSKLTSIAIPNGVMSIGSSAFSGCSNLTSITFAQDSTLANIGSDAFRYCSSLTSITIPASVTSIGSAAFQGCRSLTSIALPFVGATKDDTDNTHFGYIFGASSYENNASYVPTAIKEVIITGGSNIGGSAFFGCSNLTSITISASVMSIGSYAFNNCNNLTNVTFAQDSKLTSIGFYAFKNCSNLTSITLPFVGATKNGTNNTHFGYIFGTREYADNASYVPATLKEVSITGGNSIGGSAFSGCRSLTSITISASVMSIGSYAFNNCNNLTNVTFAQDSKLTSIGLYAFRNCSSLTSITLPFVGETKNGTNNTHFGYIFGASSYENNASYVPATLKEVSITGGNSIGGSAFFGCRSLTSITISASVMSIGSYAFSDCTNLTNVTFAQDSKLTSIGFYAFKNCSNLTSITIPSEVTSIGGDAFRNCSNLTSVTFGQDSKLTSIDSYAFENCTSLTSITIPASVTNIGDAAFSGCDKLEYETYAGTLKYLNNWLIAATNTSITTATLKPTTVGIHNSAFSGCSSLTSITVPSGITSIGSLAFKNCSNLTIYFEQSSSAGVTFGGNWNGSSRPIYYGVTEATFVVTGEIHYFLQQDGTTVVTGKEAGISTASILESVTIGGTAYEVTSIGNSAFSGCSKLTSITIPASVTSIGSYAFSGCTSLTSITIPSGVISIGSETFRGCNSLTIYFERADSTGVILGSGWNNNNRPVYYGVTEATFIVIGGIHYFLQQDCTAVVTGEEAGITTATILDSVTIGGTAYEITSIGNSAFSGCSSLTSITIPGEVMSIGSYAFYNCTSLTSVTFAQGSKLANIGSSAFSGCSNLISVTFAQDSKLTSIGSSAFSGCSSLTSITIPSTVASIGSYAFSGCSSLTIYCEAANQPVGWKSGWNYSDRPVYWNWQQN